MERVDINRFLQLMESCPAFDVRTPKEFKTGHIPGAINLPLFTDDERAIVGTIYKRSGREKAILSGLDIVGPKMRWLAESVRKKAKGGTALIHCWRGGMRSESVAWLVEYTGVKTVILEKGYKAYRTWCIERFNEERKIVILSGRTGSGKTEILSHLKNIGEQMIDLEGIAHHKGSAFGSLGELPQPPQEHFENVLAWQLSQTSPSRRLWLEDESLHVGRCVIPDALWPKMRTAPVVVADIPFERRVDYLLQSYGTFDPYQLTLSTRKIEKRFGPERTKECLSAIESGDIRTAISISLDYYDRTYDHGLSKRVNPVIFRHAVDDAQSLADIAAALVRLADENNLT